jgi:hypothetical protein
MLITRQSPDHSMNPSPLEYSPAAMRASFQIYKILKKKVQEMKVINNIFKKEKYKKKNCIFQFSNTVHYVY